MAESSSLVSHQRIKLITNLAAESSLWCQGWEESRWAQRFFSSWPQDTKVRELTRPSVYVEDLWHLLAYSSSGRSQNPPPCHPKPEMSPFSFWILAGTALLLWATFIPSHVDACTSQQRPRLLSDFSGFPHSPLSVRGNFSCFSTPVIRSGVSGKCFYLVTGQLSHFTISSQEQ